jgi:H2-forming N5,N10-methylenetetrahydromethanopterin dehydrogenase-like enzyme
MSTKNQLELIRAIKAVRKEYAVALMRSAPTHEQSEICFRLSTLLSLINVEELENMLEVFDKAA